MRKRRIVILGLAVGSWLAIACSTGSGGLIELGDGYDRPPDLRDNPGNGREAPPLSGENPGSQGGGPGTSGSGGSTCPPCDQRFTCVSGNEKDTIKLETVNGQCSAGKGVTLDCNGKFLLNGTAVGTWQGTGSSFTVTYTLDGKTETQTCTPATTTAPTSTGTTTAPTGTTTSVPPVDAGAKTCADLLACCGKIANASLKSSCNSAYTTLNPNNAQCSAVYPSYASSCP